MDAMLLRNVDWLSTDCKALYPGRYDFHNRRCENLKSYIEPLLFNNTKATKETLVVDDGKTLYIIILRNMEAWSSIWRNISHKNPLKIQSSTSQKEYRSCKIWDFHGDGYEESRFLGSGAV
jgi:hypothetical protein